MTRLADDGTRQAVTLRARPRWGSARAALQAWADYRLADAPIRSSSDFGGSGGGPRQRDNAPLDAGMREYTDLVEVDRAVLAAFGRENLPHHLRGPVQPGVWRAILVERVVGKPIDTREAAHAKAEKKRQWKSTDKPVPPRCKACSDKLHVAGVRCEACHRAGRVALYRWAETNPEDVAEAHGVTQQQVSVAVRHGLAEITDALAARGLVPARRVKGQARTTKAYARKVEQDPEVLSGWKEIASYLGKSTKTAMRWYRAWQARETPMPIRRDVQGWPMSTRAEIAAWREAAGAAWNGV